VPSAVWKLLIQSHSISRLKSFVIVTSPTIHADVDIRLLQPLRTEIGDISPPDLIDRPDIDASEQVWIDLVLWIGLTQFGLGINRL
jgi:hypothetical protein